MRLVARLVVGRASNGRRAVMNRAFDSVASFAGGIANGGASFAKCFTGFGGGLFGVCAGLIGFRLAASSQTQCRNGGDRNERSHSVVSKPPQRRRTEIYTRAFPRE